MQIYEPYWSYTAAFTDLSGAKSLATLQICLEYLDAHANEFYTKESYDKMQREIQQVTGIDLISIRKAINQFVKLGFLSPMLTGYPLESKEFLYTKNDRRRKSLMSKIVYKYANFDNSMTKPIYTTNRQINFFIRTLEEVGRITEKELVAMMIVDINQHKKGFLDAEELNKYYLLADSDGFISRKYNQISHLKNLLGKLDDLVSYDGAIYFVSDAKRIFGDTLEARNIYRDPYLQRVYNYELEDESITQYGSAKPKSMLIGASDTLLVPSHIKPYQDSQENEEFDINNGLLLDKDTSKLFGEGLMTFDNNGAVIPSLLLGEDMHQQLSRMSLNEKFVNRERMTYMDYHREHIFKNA